MVQEISSGSIRKPIYAGFEVLTGKLISCFMLVSCLAYASILKIIAFSGRHDKKCQFSLEGEERSLDLRKPNKTGMKTKSESDCCLCQEWQLKVRTIVS
jgi:hypothetical protein